MIELGQKIPEVTVKTMTEEGPQDLSTTEFFKGKKVALFAVPGAFTPTCSAAHLPGFVVSADQILNRGIDVIACLSVNDVFVMDAWGRASNAQQITMLADGNADFVKALGLELDGTGWGMGLRSKRFSMIVDDGVLQNLQIDESGFDKSSAENLLASLS